MEANMKVDFGNDILHINRSAMQHLKQQPPIGTSAKNAIGVTIPTSMLKHDGFAEFTALQKPYLTGIEIDISRRPVEWGPYVESIKDGDYYDQIYTNLIQTECYYIQRTRINADDNSIHFLNPEEVRNTFFGYYESYLNELNDMKANGKIDESEYHNRLQGLGKAYDRLLYRYAFQDAPTFEMFEMCLNDIKTRFSNGDFGKGPEVFEERLAAWNTAFDRMIAGTQEAARLKIGGLAAGFYGEYFKDDQSRMTASSQFLSDIETSLNNAREHLLAGGSADRITDDILNKGCLYTTEDDRRFLFSEEFKEMQKALDHTLTLYIRTPINLEQDKKGIEDTCANLIERIKLNAKIGDTLKTTLIQRLSFAAEFLPMIFKRIVSTS
jgi:hypothetical protein